MSVLSIRVLLIISAVLLQACASAGSDRDRASEPNEPSEPMVVMSASSATVEDDRWSTRLAEDGKAKSPFRPNGKIDFPYWDQYLARHGSDATITHFFELSADQPAVAAKSFERFCRFNQILPTLKQRREN